MDGPTALLQAGVHHVCLTSRCANHSICLLCVMDTFLNLLANRYGVESSITDSLSATSLDWALFLIEIRSPLPIQIKLSEDWGKKVLFRRNLSTPHEVRKTQHRRLPQQPTTQCCYTHKDCEHCLGGLSVPQTDQATSPGTHGPIHAQQLHPRTKGETITRLQHGSLKRMCGSKHGRLGPKDHRGKR